MKAYVASHHELLATVETAVNEVCYHQPLDPWRQIAAVLLAKRQTATVQLVNTCSPSAHGHDPAKQPRSSVMRRVSAYGGA